MKDMKGVKLMEGAACQLVQERFNTKLTKK